MYCEKERKAKWYQKGKQVKRASRCSSRTSSVTSEERDYPCLLSPASSVPSTSDGVQEISAEGEHNQDEADDNEYDESEQVFHQGLPVEQQ